MNKSLYLYDSCGSVQIWYNFFLFKIIFILILYKKKLFSIHIQTKSDEERVFLSGFAETWMCWWPWILRLQCHTEVNVDFFIYQLSPFNYQAPPFNHSDPLWNRWIESKIFFWIFRQTQIGTITLHSILSHQKASQNLIHYLLYPRRLNRK